MPTLPVQAAPLRCALPLSHFFEEGSRPQTELKFEKGMRYRVQLKSDPSLYNLKYKGLSAEGDHILHEFIGTKGAYYRIPMEDIFAARPKGMAYTHFERWLNTAKEMILKSQALARQLFLPIQDLAQKESAVQVVGTGRSSLKGAEQIAERVYGFDQHFLSLGFQRPLKTLIWYEDRSLLPDFYGPFALNAEVINRPSQKIADATISTGRDSQYVNDTSLLLHERTHTLLNRTYRSEAWVLENVRFEEALSDFFSAHWLDAPVIGDNGTGSAIRNLKTREARLGLRSYNRKDLLSLQEKPEEHLDSLLISHALWSVREALGKELLSESLKLIVDSLNKHHQSYQESLRAEGREYTEGPSAATYDLEYTLVVLKKLNQSDWQKTSVDEVISRLVQEYQLSDTRIERLAQKLQKSEADFSYVDHANDENNIKAWRYGVAGLAVDTAIIASPIIYGLTYLF